MLVGSQPARRSSGRRPRRPCRCRWCQSPDGQPVRTVINTPEDLLRLLDENAEFREAARRHILTDELIRLPERFAQFVDRVESFIEEQRTFNQRMETTVGELRGNVARQIVGMYRREITAGLELVYQRSLDRHELFAMLPPITTSGIARGDWHSFYRADLVLEATDREATSITSLLKHPVLLIGVTPTGPAAMRRCWNGSRDSLLTPRLPAFAMTMKPSAKLKPR